MISGVITLPHAHILLGNLSFLYLRYLKSELLISETLFRQPQ